MGLASRLAGENEGSWGSEDISSAKEAQGLNLPRDVLLGAQYLFPFGLIANI